jgi:hypothetical protein
LVLCRVDPPEAQGVARWVLRLDLSAVRQGVLAVETVLKTPVLGGINLWCQAPGEEQDGQRHESPGQLWHSFPAIKA